MYTHSWHLENGVERHFNGEKNHKKSATKEAVGNFSQPNVACRKSRYVSAKCDVDGMNVTRKMS